MSSTRTPSHVGLRITLRSGTRAGQCQRVRLGCPWPSRVDVPVAVDLCEALVDNLVALLPPLDPILIGRRLGGLLSRLVDPVRERPREKHMAQDRALLNGRRELISDQPHDESAHQASEKSTHDRSKRGRRRRIVDEEPARKVFRVEHRTWRPVRSRRMISVAKGETRLMASAPI